MMKKKFSTDRIKYFTNTMDTEDIHPDPFRQFETWFARATENDPEYASAMILSTSSPECRPSSRVVLLKGVEEGGFVFFSNYLSRKAKDLERNPFASLLFFWPECRQQLRIEGKVARISNKVSSEYFATRHEDSQAAAWASIQSEKIPDRKYLDNTFRAIKEKYRGKEIPKPPYWGGYVLIPEYFEFWQGQPGRLHDRLAYSRADQSWIISRLSP